MKTATVVVEAPGEAPGTASSNAEGARSPYLDDLYVLMDEIETLFPDVVRALRARITDLEQFVKREGNVYLKNGAIAAVYATVQAVHDALRRIVK